jgi:hypothetical protein
VGGELGDGDGDGTGDEIDCGDAYEGAEHDGDEDAV